MDSSRFALDPILRISYESLVIDTRVLLNCAMYYYISTSHEIIWSGGGGTILQEATNSSEKDFSTSMLWGRAPMAVAGGV